MKIGVPREIHAGERRVALTPDTAARIRKLGFDLCIEQGAGAAAEFDDDAYRAAGVTVVEDTRALWAGSDIILKVRPPEMHSDLGEHEADLLPTGATLIGFIFPTQHGEVIARLRERQATVIAMDAVPRISRAQKLDALSSMANIAGSRAVLEAANSFGRFFTGQITAAGKVPPARVLVIGAGVAGLAAIGAARSMGAVVRAFDTRSEVRQQIESMGAEFLEIEIEEEGAGAGGYARVMSEAFIRAEMALFAEQARKVDIIITTALIPGQKAPVLITSEMVQTMRPGSVVVDLAAEQGGNCELTEPDQQVVRHGVTVIGYTDLPSRMANQASQLYGMNLFHLLSELAPSGDGAVVLDMEDEVTRHATLVKAGEVVPPPPPPQAPPSTAPEPDAAAASPKEPAAPRRPGYRSAAVLVAGGLALLGLGLVAPPSFMGHLTVFVLACFVGWQVIWNVTPALHTPLMSVTNAISGIIVIGALLQISNPSGLVVVLAAIAVLIATINIAGGFLVTQRMLRMFRKS